MSIWRTTGVGVATKGAMNKLSPPRVLSLIHDDCFYGFRDAMLRKLSFLGLASVFGMAFLILRIYGNFAYRCLSTPSRFSELLLLLLDRDRLVLCTQLLCIVLL